MSVINVNPKKLSTPNSKKRIKTQLGLGEVEIKVPRDRNGEYEPQIRQ